MSKAYSTKFNATRAARKDLGADAIPGTDFWLIPAGDGWTYTDKNPDGPAPVSPPPPVRHFDPAAAFAAIEDGTDKTPSADMNKVRKVPGGKAGARKSTPPRDPAKEQKTLGKRAAAVAAAQAGNVPAAPDFSAETHRRYRGKLAAIVAAIEAGDVAAARAVEFTTSGSSGKALARYRDLAITALEAKSAAAV